MSAFSDNLKQRADLAQLIGEVVALRPGGNGFIGLCPFHSEKSPSFHVHTAKRFYYCFGCHAHGDVYRFFMELRKVSFPEAVEMVAERLGVEVPRAADAAANDPLRRELLRIHAAARDYFTDALSGRVGAAARAYLESRELPPAAVSPFHVGYAPESGRGLAQFLEAQKFAPALALRAGLCQMRRESAGRQAAEPDPGSLHWSDLYDRFRHRLIFPIHDERGQTIAFGGRSLANDDKSPKYLNSPEHPLYTKGKVLYNLDRAREAVRNLDHSILVEGYFDCLRVFLAGFQNVVASCGTALTSAQIVPLGRLSKNAVVNFDPDTAGAAAAERSIGLLLEEGFKMRVVVLEGGLDPDLFIRRQGAAAYGAALRSSRSFFDYLAERARGQFDLRRGEGKLQAVNHLLPFISHIHEPILRQSAAENLAAQLGIDQPLLTRQLLAAARQRQSRLSGEAVKPPETLYAERVLLRAWMEWEPRRAEIAAQVAEEGLLQGLASEAMFAALASAPAGSDWQQLTERLGEAERPWLAQIVLSADARGVHDPPLSEGDWAAALASLRARRQAAERRGLQERIREAAANGDRQSLATLLREKTAADLEARK